MDQAPQADAVRQGAHAPVEVRLATAEDESFIFSTWLNHLRQNSPLVKRVPKAIYYAKQHRVIEQLLATSTVYVAYLEESPNTILGYLVVDRQRSVLHWCYVKGPWRRLGVARLLLRAAAVEPNKCVFTSWTNDLNQIIERWPGAVYDPFLLNS